MFAESTNYMPHDEIEQRAQRSAIGPYYAPNLSLLCGPDQFQPYQLRYRGEQDEGPAWLASPSSTVLLQTINER